MNPEVAARTAIAHIRQHYDESIFPPRPKGPHTQVYDGEAAAVARLICDHVLEEFERMLDEDDEDEVEVTTDLEQVRVVAPKVMRRSGAKNVVSSPHLQSAFIDEARSVMGQPTDSDVLAMITKRVRLVFNFEQEPVVGTVTEIVYHPASTYIVLDNDHHTMYPVNSLQSIEEA